MMNKNILFDGLTFLRKKSLVLVAGSFLLVSCGTQMGGYSETDGVYYDPNKDTLPEGVILNDNGNQVGEYYDYQENSIIENSEMNSQEQKNKYQDWNNISNDSDWGAFSGNQTNYYDNSYFGWNSPWGFGYSPYFGSSFGFGYGYPYGNIGYNFYGGFGYGGYWGMNYGNYYSFYPYYGYNPYYFGFSPYYYGYNPYFNYYGYGNNFYNSEQDN